MDKFENNMSSNKKIILVVRFAIAKKIAHI